MERLITISDIHGQINALEDLMHMINPNLFTDKFIFLGDYIDKGDKSREVIEFLIDFGKKYDCEFLLGNHEDSFIKFIKNRNRYSHTNQKTIDSYTKENEVFEVPTTHMKWLFDLKLFHKERGFAFVHAGVSPGCLLEDCDKDVLLKIRKNFYSYPEMHKDGIIVHGHSSTGSIKFKDNRISVDTGAGDGKLLSAVDVLNSHIWQVKISHKG